MEKDDSKENFQGEIRIRYRLGSSNIEEIYNKENWSGKEWFEGEFSGRDLKEISIGIFEEIHNKERKIRVKKWFENF